MAPYFSLHPAFLTTKEMTSALLNFERHTVSVSVESTTAPEQNSEEGHPFRGVLQSDPALKGPGTRTISLDEKVAPDAALLSPQKRCFGD